VKIKEVKNRSTHMLKAFSFNRPAMM